MYIDTIQLKNYKCFKDFSMKFETPVTTLTGFNGCGKTTILEFIAESLYCAKSSESQISCIHEGVMSYDLKQVQTTPVFAYYGSHRQYTTPQELESDLNYKSGLFSQNTYPMLNWLQTKHQDGFITAPKTQDMIGNMEKVLHTFWKDFKSFEFDDESQLLFNSTRDISLGFNDLSNSTRNVMMCADIAWRCLRFGDLKDFTQTPGVILIDNFDLSLDVEMQPEMLIQLHTIFPNIQFITTTHSPLALVEEPWNICYNINGDHVESIF